MRLGRVVVRGQLPRHLGKPDLIDHLPHISRAQERTGDTLPSRFGVIKPGLHPFPHLLEAGIDLLLLGCGRKIGHLFRTLGELDYIIGSTWCFLTRR